MAGRGDSLCEHGAGSGHVLLGHQQVASDQQGSQLHKTIEQLLLQPQPVILSGAEGATLPDRGRGRRLSNP